MSIWQGRKDIVSGYSDLLAPVSSGRVPPANAPTWTAFKPGGVGGLFQYAFSIGDYIFISPFHVNHDAKPGGNAYFHVHWTTDGATNDTNSVKWSIEYTLAKGHNQAAFSNPVSITLEQAMSATPYRHMIIETVTPLVLPEPDMLIISKIQRVTNGATDNADTVFGLNVDLHYESDRLNTPNKAPNFYS